MYDCEFTAKCLVSHERSGTHFHKGWIYACKFTTVSDTFLVLSRCGEGYAIYAENPLLKEILVDYNGVEAFKFTDVSCIN